MRLLVPCYVPPEDGWWDLVLAAPAGTRVIFSPNSGPDERFAAGYRERVEAGRAAGIETLGYVRTAWGARPVGLVREEVERYRRWYAPDGIFFDEVSGEAATLGYYRKVVIPARSRFPGGPMVFNPGWVEVARGLFDLADTMVTFEDAFANADSGRGRHGYAQGHLTDLQRAPRSLRDGSLPPEQLGQIVLGAPRGLLRGLVAQARAEGVGWLFVTERTIDERPFKGPPVYWDELVALVGEGELGGRAPA